MPGLDDRSEERLENFDRPLLSLSPALSVLDLDDNAMVSESLQIERPYVTMRNAGAEGRGQRLDKVVI